MKKNMFVIFLILLLFSTWKYSFAQEYDLLLKGGHVFDLKNTINEVMDVAISGKGNKPSRTGHIERGFRGGCCRY